MSFISSICHLCVTSIPASLVQLKQPEMDPSLCLQSKLNESPPFRSSTLAALLKQDWLPVGRFYKGLDFAYFTTVDAILQFLTVSYLAHRNQVFTMHDHICGRERISLALFLQDQIDHKIKTNDTQKNFKFFKFPLISQLLIHA